MPLDERVLVIPDSHFRAVGYFEGIRPADEDFVRRLLDPAVFTFRPRSEIETDPGFKQLIPYVILTCGDLIFHYRRGTKGSETRLTSLRSIGIGGHISEADAAGDGDPYAIGMQRELDEEVDFGNATRRNLLGFIYDPRTLVGSVHLGIVHRIELASPEANSRDEAIVETGFSARYDLTAACDQFETWSQLTLTHGLK